MLNDLCTTFSDAARNSCQFIKKIVPIYETPDGSFVALCAVSLWFHKARFTIMQMLTLHNNLYARLKYVQSYV